MEAKGHLEEYFGDYQDYWCNLDFPFVNFSR